MVQLRSLTWPDALLVLGGLAAPKDDGSWSEADRAAALDLLPAGIELVGVYSTLSVSDDPKAAVGRLNLSASPCATPLVLAYTPSFTGSPKMDAFWIAAGAPQPAELAPRTPLSRAAALLRLRCRRRLAFPAGTAEQACLAASTMSHVSFSFLLLFFISPSSWLCPP